MSAAVVPRALPPQRATVIGAGPPPQGPPRAATGSGWEPPKRGRKGSGLSPELKILTLIARMESESHRQDAKAYFEIRQLDGSGAKAWNTHRHTFQSLLTWSEYLTLHAGGKSFRDATPLDCQKYVAWLKRPRNEASPALGGRGCGELVALQRKIQLKMFYRYLVDPDAFVMGRKARMGIPDHPAVAWFIVTERDLRAAEALGRLRIKDHEIVTEDDVRLAISRTTDLKERATIALLWDTGLRREEVTRFNLRSYILVRTVDEHGNEILEGVITLPDRFWENGQWVPAHYKTIYTQRSISIGFACPHVEAMLQTHPLRDLEDRQDLDVPMLYTDVPYIWNAVRDKMDDERAVRESGGRLRPRLPPITQDDMEMMRLSSSGVRSIIDRTWERAGLKKLGKRANALNVRHSRNTHLGRVLTEPFLRRRAGWAPGSKMPERYVHKDEAIIKEGVRRADGLPTPVSVKPRKSSVLHCSKGHQNPEDARFCLRLDCREPLTLARKQMTRDVQQELKMTDGDAGALRQDAVTVARRLLVREALADRDGLPTEELLDVLAQEEARRVLESARRRAGSTPRGAPRPPEDKPAAPPACSHGGNEGKRFCGDCGASLAASPTGKNS